MRFGPASVVLLVAVVQGLVFAGFLLTRRQNRAANRLLALFVLVFAMTLVPGAIGLAGACEAHPWLLFAPFSLTLGFGPLLRDEGVFEMPADAFTDVGDGYLELRRPFAPLDADPMPVNRFDGTVIALCSAADVSGATILLALLQEHQGVIVIGEPTGGSAEGPTAGVIFTLTLPHSDIRVRIPALRSWVNVPGPAPVLGVPPDVVVRPTRASWLAGDDPVRDAARQWGR